MGYFRSITKERNMSPRPLFIELSTTAALNRMPIRMQKNLRTSLKNIIKIN